MSSIFEDILSGSNATTKNSIKKENKKDKNSWEAIKGNLPYTIKAIDKWTTRDLFFFFSDLFENNFGEPFETSLATGCQQILLIQDEIAKRLHHRPSSQLTKDYIEWFMENKSSSLIAKYGCLKLRFFRAYWEIDNFLEEYQQQQNISTNKSTIDIELLIDENSSTSDLILQCGLVLSTGWLIRKRGMAEKDAVSEVFETAKKLIEENYYTQIIEVTEKHSPYHTSFYFSSFENMLEQLTEDTGLFFDFISVEFLDNKVCHF